MNKIELLAPAGSLEKAKIALLYGADAVYVGGQKFSLRARASNFSLQDLKELGEFAKKNRKKVYVTMNIIPHTADLNGLVDYLKSLQQFEITGIISSSMYIMETAKVYAPELERHVSTQMSIANSGALDFWTKQGAKRCVLAREVTLEEMKEIAKNSKVELEVFIHGGMCASYSGRCVLSNHMTERDANRGGCAHSCRWNYDLYYSSKKINIKKTFFSMGSKDLMALKYIPELMDLGIASLKIEGRMKSTYYLATVVRCYRKLIDYYEKHKNVPEDIYLELLKEMKKAENRQTSTGFYEGIPDEKAQLFDTSTEVPTKEYVGFVLDYNKRNNLALIEQRNYFEVGDRLEFFGPKLENTECVATTLVTKDTKEEITVARHPLQQFYMEVPFPVKYGDMIRKIDNLDNKNK